MNRVSIRTARTSLGPVVLAVGAAVSLSAVGTASAAECVPGLLLAAPAYAEAGGAPAELAATDRCSGDPAAGAFLYAAGMRGALPVGEDGRVLAQFAGAGTYRLWAGDGGVRSNTVVIAVR
jgi:hypothetical protein